MLYAYCAFLALKSGHKYLHPPFSHIVFVVVPDWLSLVGFGSVAPTAGTNEPKIADLTTYIDPVKFNYIFADTNLDAMNFWVQTKFDIKVRRLISAKQIPNL